MARNRAASQSFNLYVGPTPATGTHSATGAIKQIHRLRSIGGPEWSYTRENINIIGKLAAPFRDSLESPTVNLSFSYYLTDLENEASLGFDTAGASSCLGNILQKTQDEKNYFILMVGEGVDAIGKGGADGQVLGIGNGVLSSYSIEGGVGDYATVNVSVEGLNLRGYLDGVSEEIPAINPTTGLQIQGINFTLPTGTIGSGNKPFVIRPGDITVDLSNASPLFVNITGLCVQSFNISFDLSREGIQCLGSKFDKAKELVFPIDVNFSVEVLGNDIKQASLTDFICNTGAYTASVTLRQPTCTGTGSVGAKFTLAGLSLNSESFNLDVNDNQTVSINWAGQISASGDLANGLFMSGISSY